MKVQKRKIWNYFDFSEDEDQEQRKCFIQLVESVRLTVVEAFKRDEEMVERVIGIMVISIITIVSIIWIISILGIFLFGDI